VGERSVTINTVGWAVGKRKHRSFGIQTVSGPYTKQYPVELAHGKSADFMVLRLCTESAFWRGAGCIKFYAPKFGKYFWSARSRENRHWMKLFGNLETDSGRLVDTLLPSSPARVCVRRHQFQRTKDSKTGPGQVKTLAVSGAARLEV
jgi:hypothetical protein